MTVKELKEKLENVREDAVVIFVEEKCSWSVEGALIDPKYKDVFVLRSSVMGDLCVDDA